MKFGLWYDYYYNEDNKVYILDEYQLLDGEWELKSSYERSNRFDIHYVILENTEKELELTANPNFISDVFVVFIPGYYLDPEYSSEKVKGFLNQSEFYYAHDAAIQSNVQGYVYSVFFNKEKMYSLLEKLNVNRIIINRKRLDESGLEDFDVMVD